MRLILLLTRELVGRVAETEGHEPIWIGGLGAEEEDEEIVAGEGLAEVEIVVVEGSAGVCYDEVEG